MKRSEINRALANAHRCFAEHGWALPPNPSWDVTDFGLNQFSRYGAVLVNLSLEKEYSEKIIYQTDRQAIPNHCHHLKKEDIICRFGVISIQIWFGAPRPGKKSSGQIQINNVLRPARSGQMFHLTAGERLTITPHLYHEFWALSTEAIVGEVSTRNDDAHDNYFANPQVGRFPSIEEDEPPLFRLVSEKPPRPRRLKRA